MEGKINRKDPKGIGFASCIVAAVFLLEPNFSTIDILPDFLGYMAMFFGIIRLADMNGRIEEARSGFFKLIFITLAKFLSPIVLFGMVMPQERPEALLLSAFVFALVECICGVPAWLKFFEGVNDLAVMNDGTVAIEGKRGGTGYTDKIKRYVLFAIIAKAVLSVLPEFAAIGDDRYQLSGVAYSKLYDFIGLFRTLAGIVSLIIGTVLLIRIWIYVAKITKDRIFINNLFAKYETEVLPRTGLFVYRRIRTGAWLVLAASILSVDIFLDNINYIPDAIGAAVMIGAAAVLYKYAKKAAVALAAISAALGCVSVWSTVASAELFLGKYSISIVDKYEESRLMFEKVQLLTVAESVLFVAVMVAAVVMLVKITSEHTGAIRRDMDSEYIHQIHKSINIRLYVALAASVLSEACSIMYIYVVAGNEFISEVAWIIDFCAAVLFSILAAYAISVFRQELERKNIV